MARICHEPRPTIGPCRWLNFECDDRRKKIMAIRIKPKLNTSCLAITEKSKESYLNAQRLPEVAELKTFTTQVTQPSTGYFEVYYGHFCPKGKLNGWRSLLQAKKDQTEPKKKDQNPKRNAQVWVDARDKVFYFVYFPKVIFFY